MKVKIFDQPKPKRFKPFTMEIVIQKDCELAELFLRLKTSPNRPNIQYCLDYSVDSELFHRAHRLMNDRWGDDGASNVSELQDAVEEAVRDKLPTTQTERSGS